MYKKRRILNQAAMIILPVVLFISCDRHRNMPGWDFMPDMIYSQAFEAYTENPVFGDSPMKIKAPSTGSSFSKPV